MLYTDHWIIAVSFVGPSSGNLIRRLNHQAAGPDATLTVLGTSFTLTILEFLTIMDINLHQSATHPLGFPSRPARTGTHIAKLLNTTFQPSSLMSRRSPTQLNLRWLMSSAALPTNTVIASLHDNSITR